MSPIVSATCFHFSFLLARGAGPKPAKEKSCAATEKCCSLATPAETKPRKHFHCSQAPSPSLILKPLSPNFFLAALQEVWQRPGCDTRHLRLQIHVPQQESKLCLHHVHRVRLVFRVPGISMQLFRHAGWQEYFQKEETQPAKKPKVEVKRGRSWLFLLET